jgi:PAS fold
VMSMHDGVVVYTTPSITNSLGFPRDMWLGRSFIDFVHPKDRCGLTFCSSSEQFAEIFPQFQVNFCQSNHIRSCSS